MTKSLKGDLEGDIEIAEIMMCYQSFQSRDFKIGATYVFPLAEVDLANPSDVFYLMLGDIPPDAPSYKMYVLPICAHTGLLSDGEMLYTNEFNSRGDRWLEPYMSLATLKVLFATGLFDFWRGLAAVGVAIALAVIATFGLRRRSKARSTSGKGDSR